MPAEQPVTVRHTVREVAGLLGCSVSTLRAWEKAGLITPDRTAHAYRRYTDADIERFRRIQYLRRVQKLNLPAIRRVLGEPTPPSRAPDAGEYQVSVGQRLRELRDSRAMSLADAATATGLSRSFISMLERGRTGVSMVGLRALLQAYGSTLDGLLDADAPPGHLTHPGERPVLDDRFSGIQIEQLSRARGEMSVQLYRARPGASSEGAYTHTGEEFIFLLRGLAEVTLDGTERCLLRAGDCLYFSSTTPHAWRNAGLEPLEMLWVNTPPSF
jgi:DNA-binding transcriptional MerR regulator/quercetin dioxygenase-like cupin family protein